jgi:hypothetical protein
MRSPSQVNLRRGGGRRAGAVLALLAAVALLGQARCIWGTDEDYLAAGELTRLQARGNDPVAGETAVPRTARLTLRFTDRVRPQSVVPGAVRLLEGGAGALPEPGAPQGHRAAPGAAAALSRARAGFR